MAVAIDPASGLAIPQPRIPLGGKLGMGRPVPKGYGTIIHSASLPSVYANS